MLTIPTPDTEHKKGTIRNIIECTVYNFITAFSGFMFTVTSIMGFTWMLNAAGQVDTDILPYLKELAAVTSGAGTWYGAAWLVGTIIDSANGSSHFDNLVSTKRLKRTLIINPAYSRLNAFLKRFITPTIGVGLLIWLFGYIIGLNRQQLSQLLQPVLVGLSMGGTLASVPVLIVSYVQNNNKAQARQDQLNQLNTVVPPSTTLDFFGTATHAMPAPVLSTQMQVLRPTEMMFPAHSGSTGIVFRR